MAMSHNYLGNAFAIGQQVTAPPLIPAPIAQTIDWGLGLGSSLKIAEQFGRGVGAGALEAAQGTQPATRPKDLQAATPAPWWQRIPRAAVVAAALLFGAGAILMIGGGR